MIHKKCAGETAIRVRQRDQHEVFSRPDMQCVFFKPVRAVCTRGYVQLDIALRHVGLAVAESWLVVCQSSYLRVGAIGAERKVGRHNNLLASPAAEGRFR